MAKNKSALPKTKIDETEQSETKHEFSPSPSLKKAFQRIDLLILGDHATMVDWAVFSAKVPRNEVEESILFFV